MKLNKVIKRDGSTVDYDSVKINEAVLSAFKEIDGEITAVAKSIAHRISKSISNIEKSTLSVEEIQDAVEDKLMASNRKDVARAYVRFRYKKEMLRHANTTDKSILALLDGTNNYLKKENSNKNADLNTTIRDYMAGEVSKDISRRILLPQDVVEAHDEAVIHFHDADYYAQHMHNCFNKDTEFVTSEGIKSFKDFSDGDKVIVLDKDGIFREATVHSYGQQKMYEVTFVTENEEKIVVCTRDHRWILRDETVTTHLSVGDVLIGNKEWTVSYISPSEVEEAWCVEEPVTHSFTLEGCMVTGNCDLVNLEDMLQNGTVISDTLIEKPHSFSTACNIATQIIAQVASAQYGGQSVSLAHLAPFVDISRQKIRKEVEEEVNSILRIIPNTSDFPFEETVARITEDRLLKEIKKGVQTIQYQVVTLMTTNGQAPFLTVFMYLNEAKNEQEKADLAMIIEETLRQRIQGVKNEVGVWVTPAFPKLIYVLEEDNVEEDSKYFYLTELSAKCSVRRLVPDYISEKVMKELKEGNCFPVMGCRSALNPWKDENGEYKFYGRWNQGVVTLNLPDVALSSGGDMDKFWQLMDERTELCHKALKCRHERLEGTPSNVAPILWQHGALGRLKKDEPIDKLLHGGYSSISLGYAGLYECVKYMTGNSHTDNGIGEEFGLKVMTYLNDKCDKWTEEENVGYSIYGTPLESTTYKFAKGLKKRFGVIEGITDRDYITNSYHVPVFENIDAFTKLKLESKFQALSKGGAISYVEVGDLTQNEEVAIQLIRFIYNNIMYAELNSKSDYCMECGYNGEIKLIEENRELIWECPNCKNRNHDTLDVTRRTCGLTN